MKGGLERILHNIIKTDRIQFRFMPGKGTVHAIFFRRQEYYADKKKKLCMCFVDLDAFDLLSHPVMGVAETYGSRQFGQDCNGAVR